MPEIISFASRFAKGAMPGPRWSDAVDDAQILASVSCSVPEGEARARLADVGRLFAKALRVTPIEQGVETEHMGVAVRGGDSSSGRAAGFCACVLGGAITQTRAGRSGKGRAAGGA